MEPHIWKIEWNDEMSVGIAEIDEDHKRFIFLIDELNRAIVDRMDLTEIKRRLQIIFDDAAQHFAHEEELLTRLKYPDAAEHANHHTQALKALDAIREKFITYDLPSEWIGFGLEVKDILINHFLTDDMKFAEYFRNARQPGEQSR